jgi:hypothetical protein
MYGRGGGMKGSDESRVKADSVECQAGLYRGAGSLENAFAGKTTPRIKEIVH